MKSPFASCCLVLLTWVTLCACGGCDFNSPGDGTPEITNPETNGEDAPVADPAAELSSEIESPIQFVEIPAAASGIDFQHVSGNATDKPFPAANGSGVGALDYDLDGLVDLYFATGAHFPLTGLPDSPTNQAYRNMGDWQFVNVTAQTRLELHRYSAGVAVGDYDSDGFPDVYVTCVGENQLFHNCGDGTFEEVAVVSGGDFSTSSAFLDYDADGLLDLYVGNYGIWDYEHNAYCGDRSRNVRIFCSPKTLEPELDRLLRNEGDGTFRDVTTETGVDAANGRAQGVLATDVNGDGRIDLYLGNDSHPNFLFLNTAEGRFENATQLTGTAYDRHGQMQAGMGLAGADVDRDGQWDLFVTNFEGEYNTLYLQSSPDVFFDVSMTHGLAAASKTWVGWGTALADFDLDGWKDLIVTNGQVDDNLKAMGHDSPYEEPPLVWKNEAGRFRLLGESVGGYFRRLHPGRGLATADLDNDGALDVVIVHQDRQPTLLRNNVFAGPTPHVRSLAVRLVGTLSNRDAIGSRLVVASEGEPQIEQIQSGGSYLSSHDPRVILPIPESGQVDLEIVWPSGIRSLVTGLQASQQYDIIEPTQANRATLIFSRPPELSGKANDDRSP